MKRGPVISGRVTDSQGRPVSEAVVVWHDDPYFTPGSQETMTDKNGRYQLPPLSKNEIPVTVIAKGWEPQRRVLRKIESDHTEDFQLEPGSRLRIRITDAHGSPIPEAFIQIESWHEGSQSLYTHRHPNVLGTSIPTRADAKGIYEWTWAPRVPVQYRISAKDFRSTTATFDATDGQEFSVSLKPHAIVLGRVVDDVTDRRIESFQVLARPDQPLPADASDAGGFFRNGEYRFVLDESEPQVARLHFRASGYEPFASAIVTPESDLTRLDVRLKPAREARELNEALRGPGLRVANLNCRGIAIDEDGHPVAGAQLSLIDLIGRDRIGGTTTTDDAGQFEFQDVEVRFRIQHGVTVQEGLQVFGEHEKHAFCWSELFEIELSPGEDEHSIAAKTVQDQPLQLLFRKSAPIEGRVLDAVGKPVEGASVTIHNGETILNERPSAAGFANPQDELKSLSRKTDREGLFHFANAAPHTVYGMRVRRDANVPNPGKTLELTNDADFEVRGSRDPVLHSPADIVLESE